MKNAKRIGGIGQLIMTIGSLLYVVSLLTVENTATVVAISCIYIVAIIMMVIGWIGSKGEKKAENR